MKLALGTVQFGLPSYGIANKNGAMTNLEIANILQTAHTYGIRVLDTAALYGTSEEVIGKTLPKTYDFKIVTKTIHNANSFSLFKTFKKSLELLKQNSIYGLLIHNVKDVLKPGGKALFFELKNIKADGLVKKIGFSVYDASSIDILLDSFEFDLIQLPISIFDQRLFASGHLKKIKKHNIEIHARSIFLQGLLLMDPTHLNAYFAPIVPHLIKYHNYLKKIDTSPLEASLNFVKHIYEIDHMLIGVTNQEQLLANIIAYQRDKAVQLDYEQCALFDEAFLNPSKWSLV